MSTVGIVCEYNPFHKGHLYQIEQAKKLTEADHVVCFMSGNFLQRGIPALADKFTRAEAAIKCGVDVIFEIPFVYSTSSARDYATAAVTMMDMSGAIDFISFGSETDDLVLLSQIADIVENEPPQVSDSIRRSVASGMTYGAARATAIEDYLQKKDIVRNNPSNSSSSVSKSNISSVMSSPNNILAIEYLAALKRIKSKIKPVIIKRIISDYNSNEAVHDICSASAIRSLLRNSDIKTIERHVPKECYCILDTNYRKTFPVFEDHLSSLLAAARLLYGRYDLSPSISSFSEIVDMDRDLYNRMSKIDSDMSFSDTAKTIKSRNYTLTHIQRALLHYVMQLTKTDYDTYKSNGWIYYLRLIGLNTRAGGIVKQIKKNSYIPVITRAPEAASVLSTVGKSMFGYDIKSTAIYNSLIYSAYGTKLKNEYEHTIPVITD